MKQQADGGNLTVPDYRKKMKRKHHCSYLNDFTNVFSMFTYRDSEFDLDSFVDC